MGFLDGLRGNPKTKRAPRRPQTAAMIDAKRRLAEFKQDQADLAELKGQNPDAYWQLKFAKFGNLAKKREFTLTDLVDVADVLEKIGLEIVPIGESGGSHSSWLKDLLSTPAAAELVKGFVPLTKDALNAVQGSGAAPAAPGPKQIAAPAPEPAAVAPPDDEAQLRAEMEAYRVRFLQGTPPDVAHALYQATQTNAVAHSVVSDLLGIAPTAEHLRTYLSQQREISPRLMPAFDYLTQPEPFARALAVLQALHQLHQLAQNQGGTAA